MSDQISSDDAARSYIRDWVPDHVKDVIAADLAAAEAAAAEAMRGACVSRAKDYARNARLDITDVVRKNVGALSCLLGAEAAGQTLAREFAALPTQSPDALARHVAAAVAEAEERGLKEALKIARDAQSFVVYERIQHAIRARCRP